MNKTKQKIITRSGSGRKQKDVERADSCDTFDFAYIDPSET